MSYHVNLPVCLSACSAFTSSLPIVLQSFMKIARARCAGTERKSAGGRDSKVGGGRFDKMFSHYPSFIIPSSCIPPSFSPLVLSFFKLHFFSLFLFTSLCCSLLLASLSLVLTSSLFLSFGTVFFPSFFFRGVERKSGELPWQQQAGCKLPVRWFTEKERKREGVGGGIERLGSNKLNKSGDILYFCDCQDK